MTSTTRQARPATVTVAATLMALTAFGYLITAGTLFSQLGRARRGAQDLFGEIGMDGGGMPVFLQSAVVLTAVLTIIAALILLGAAAGVRAGRRRGRIVAWVTMGMLLLCGVSSASRSGSPEFSGNVQITLSQTDGTRTRTNAEALSSLYSDGYRIGSGIFAILAMIALGTATVLLTRPSANRWFAAEATAPGYHAPWLPPAQYGGPQPAAAPGWGQQTPGPAAGWGQQAPGPVTPGWGQPTPGPAAPGWGQAAPGLAAPGWGQPAPGQAAPGWGQPAPGQPAPGQAAPGWGQPTPGQPAPGQAAPGWGQPTPGPAAPVPGPREAAAAEAELAVLVRQHQRGELTDAEFEAARARLARP